MASKFPINQETIVMNKIVNSKLVFEITPCKLGITFIFIHKLAKILPAGQHPGHECSFSRASIKNNARSGPIECVRSGHVGGVNNEKYLHENEIYFPKEHRFIVLLLQHGRCEHTL